MAEYLQGVVNKEDFEILDKIGISDIMEVYTDSYPLLRAKKLYNSDIYQKLDSAGILMTTPSGYDFLSEEYLASYLNLPISEYDVYLTFSSIGGLYYDSLTVAAVSGDFEEKQPMAYNEQQDISIGYRTRFKLADRFGITLNIPAIDYSGDIGYMISASGETDTQFYPTISGDYFINDSLENGEVVLKPSAGESIKSYNLISDNYSYNLNETYYVNNTDLVSGDINSIIIDDLGNSIPIYYSGFDNLSLEIPFYVGDNERFFKVYRQDGITSSTTRVALEEDVDYKIDYANGKIKLYDTLNWNEETELWIQSYLYDKIYYKYIESARLEIGDTDSENYQFSHTQMRRLFHKSLQKILFWVPYEYTTENGYIDPQLDDKMIDFVSEMCKIITLQSVLNKNLGSGIKVKDGDTSLDLTAGLRPGKEITAMQLKEMKEKLRADIFEYCIDMGYASGWVESSQGTTGELW